jgi:hypothetical protein
MNAILKNNEKLSSQFHAAEHEILDAGDDT